MDITDINYVKEYMDRFTRGYDIDNEGDVNYIRNKNDFKVWLEAKKEGREIEQPEQFRIIDCKRSVYSTDWVVLAENSTRAIALDGRLRLFGD